MSSSVAVLFASSDSIYKSIPGCDVFDLERDARSYCGDSPVVAHPPCRLWSRLRYFSKAPESEKALAFFALDQVRRCGGVLEHPAHSTFWHSASLPQPGYFDVYGGFSLGIEQHDFGHRASKATWLYVCGVALTDIPRPSLVMSEVTHCNDTSRRVGRRLKYVTKRERNATPLLMAHWLVELAGRCS